MTVMGSLLLRSATLAADFVLPGFPTPTDTVVLLGTAQTTAGLLRLTGAFQNQAGVCWYTDQQLVVGEFTTDFEFRVSDPDVEGSDGFAFVIQGWGPQAIGALGGSMAYEGIPNSIAIEFDTWRGTKGTSLIISARLGWSK